MRTLRSSCEITLAVTAEAVADSAFPADSEVPANQAVPANSAALANSAFPANSAALAYSAFPADSAVSADQETAVATETIAAVAAAEVTLDIFIESKMQQN